MLTRSVKTVRAAAALTASHVASTPCYIGNASNVYVEVIIVVPLTENPASESTGPLKCVIAMFKMFLFNVFPSLPRWSNDKRGAAYGGKSSCIV